MESQFIVLDMDNDIVIASTSKSAEAQADLEECERKDPGGHYVIFIRREYVVEQMAQLALSLYVE